MEGHQGYCGAWSWADPGERGTGAVEVACHPLPHQRRRSPTRRRAVIRRCEGVRASNRGGSRGCKLVTAYRERALAALRLEEQGARPAGCVSWVAAPRPSASSTTTTRLVRAPGTGPLPALRERPAGATQYAPVVAVLRAQLEAGSDRGGNEAGTTSSVWRGSTGGSAWESNPPQPLGAPRRFEPRNYRPIHPRHLYSTVATPSTTL